MDINAMPNAFFYNIRENIEISKKSGEYLSSWVFHDLNGVFQTS